MNIGSDGRIVTRLNDAHLKELLELELDSPPVASCAQVICDGVVQGGLAFFRGAKRVKDAAPDELLRWLRKVILPFVRAVVAQLAHYGFVIYVVDAETFTPTIIELCRVNIRLVCSKYGEIRFCVTSKATVSSLPVLDDTYHDPMYRVACMDCPDIRTGWTRGCLSKARVDHVMATVLAYTHVSSSVINALPAAFFEDVDKKLVDPYLDVMSRESYKNINDSNPGTAFSASTRMQADLDLRAMRNQAGRAADMLGLKLANTVMPGIQTRMKMPNMMPEYVQRITVDSGKHVVQREPVPINGHVVPEQIWFQSRIEKSYGVPPGFGSKDTGKQQEVQEMQEKALSATCKRYYIPVNEVLEDVSKVCFDARVRESVKRMARKIERRQKCGRMDLSETSYRFKGERGYEDEDDNSSSSSSEEEEEVEAGDDVDDGGDEERQRIARIYKDMTTSSFLKYIKGLQKPVRVQLCPITGEQQLTEYYRNFVGGDAAFKDELVHRDILLREQLQEGDGRKIIAELGGPGRKGGDTLATGSHDKQRQTKGHSTSSARPRAAVGQQ